MIKLIKRANSCINCEYFQESDSPSIQWCILHKDYIVLVNYSASTLICDKYAGMVAKKTKRERIKEIISRRFPDEKFTEYGMDTLLYELIATMDESNDNKGE